MPILVVCSNSACGELFEVADEADGSEVHCPACGGSQMVGSPCQTAQPPQQEPPKSASTNHPTDQRQEENVISAGSPREEDVDLTIEEYESPDGQPADPTTVAEKFAEKSAEKADRPAPPGGAEPDNMPQETTFFSERDWIEACATTGHDADDVLKHKLMTTIIFAVGMGGMAVGLLIGLIWSGEHKILAAYVGAGAGAVVGFMFAFLLVLTAQKGSVDKLRCSLCDKVSPAGTKVCRFCGSPLQAPGIASLIGSCLKAGSYALSNLKSVYWLAMLMAGWKLLLLGTDYLVKEFPSTLGPYQPALWGFCAIVGFLIFAYWFQFFLDVTGATMARREKAPDIPRFRPLASILLGIKGVGLLGMYVLPIFTMPLLPVGLLLLAGPAKNAAFNLPGAVRAVLRHAKDFATLWLSLLLWSAAMALAIAVAVMISYGLKGLLPSVAGISGVVLSAILSAVAVAVVSAIVCIFATAMFRCVGMFARHNPVTFIRQR